MGETRSGGRTFAVALCAAAAFVTVAGTVAWALACRRLDDGVQQTLADAGWALSAGPARWGGWPFAADVTLPDVALRAGPDVIPPVRWTAGVLSLRLTALHPATLIASATGKQTLAIGTAPPVPFTARFLAATIDLAQRDPVVATAAGLEIASATGPVEVGAATLRLLPDGVAADLSGLTFSGQAGQPIQPAIQTLRFEGRIAPPVPAMPTARRSAEAWRAAGGRLTLGGIVLRWGALDATGQATGTLDANLQPALDGRVSSTGLVAVLDQLVQSGAVTASSAAAAGGILAILSAPSGGGALTLPVALRGGVVSVARVPLLRLLPLQWD